jgi:hypothetical protein
LCSQALVYRKNRSTLRRDCGEQMKFNTKKTESESKENKQNQNFEIKNENANLNNKKFFFQKNI